MGTGGPFPGVKRGRGVTLITHPRESNLDCPVVQSVARHYTDWATRHENSVVHHQIPEYGPKSLAKKQPTNQSIFIKINFVYDNDKLISSYDL
jgi:hypothetical protein